PPFSPESNPAIYAYSNKPISYLAELQKQELYLPPGSEEVFSGSEEEVLEIEETTLDEINPYKDDEEAGLKGSIETQEYLGFNSQAIWGPIEARLIPETKRTVGKLFSRNIGDLSKSEYEQMRFFIEYVLSHEDSKQRIFELTGFEDKDIAFAEKYFRRYEHKFLFSKLVGFALATSSNGKVSRQIGGLFHFAFETESLNGQEITDEYKYKFLKGFPEIIEPLWLSLLEECKLNPESCKDANLAKLDLDNDAEITQNDVDIALESINWLRSYPNNKS
ncbi:MAG TPA: hypothetical protein V6C96_04440, partial [Vampirovibrionales bacterium]